jgi:endonuclease/exonuclease/phosphatase family metal-dependent hydrolase
MMNNPDRKSELKLATWNLERARPPRRQALREHIERIGADIWVFTETNDAMCQGIFNSVSSAPDRDHLVGLDTPADHWVTIASMHRLEPLSTEDKVRTAAARVFPENGAPFVVFGLVLPWNGDNWHRHPSAGGTAFRKALALQLADWKRLRSEFPADEFFVMGDFNQDLASFHYYGSKAKRAALAGALEECGLVALTAGDRDPISRKSPRWACIDHICALRASKWKAQDAVRWPDAPHPVKGLSDHFGVVVPFLRDDSG